MILGSSLFFGNICTINNKHFYIEREVILIIQESSRQKIKCWEKIEDNDGNPYCINEKKDRIMIPINGTYPWSFVTQTFRNH